MLALRLLLLTLFSEAGLPLPLHRERHDRLVSPLCSLFALSLLLSICFPPLLLSFFRYGGVS